jgi:hypothetical protein
MQDLMHKFVDIVSDCNLNDAGKSPLDNTTKKVSPTNQEEDDMNRPFKLLKKYQDGEDIGSSTLLSNMMFHVCV